MVAGSAIVQRSCVIYQEFRHFIPKEKYKKKISLVLFWE